MKNIRIGNIECRKYTSTKTDKLFYEIIKWSINPSYGKMQEYLDDGYVDSFGTDFLQKGNSSVQKTKFELKETCFTVASLHKSEDWSLQSVGGRICELSDDELLDFMEVYKFSDKKLNKETL